VIDKLNELIQLDADAIQLYETAIEHIDDIAARQDLRAFKSDHERHVTDLARVVMDIGGHAIAPNRDLKGALLEAITAMRSVTGNLGALKAMRTNEKLTNKTYQRAFDLALPPVAYDAVVANREDERVHLAAIEMHINRLRGDGASDIDRDEVDEVAEVDEVIVVAVEDRPSARM
jgi:rubrerythrin